MPKVSVIVPVYGVEKYIERCARSLFGQSLDDIEYLFIDDCTPDRSMEVLRLVLEEYPERKHHVVIHRMKQNSGQAAVRIWGMQHASGDFVIHCDSDDWVEPDYCRTLYEAAIKEDADAVVCDYSTSDGQRILKRVCGCGSSDKGVFVNRMLYQSDPWSLCNKLFKRTACYKADLVFPIGNMGEDMLLVFQFVLNANKVVGVQDSLYNYFFNPTSITKNPSEEKILSNFKQFKANTDLLFEVFDNKGLSEQYSSGIVSCKWFVKKFLWNLHPNRVVRKLWLDTYPEIKKNVLSDSQIPLKDKLKYCLSDIGLYPFN